MTTWTLITTFGFNKRHIYHRESPVVVMTPTDFIKSTKSLKGHNLDMSSVSALPIAHRVDEFDQDEEMATLIRLFTSGQGSHFQSSAGHAFSKHAQLCITTWDERGCSAVAFVFCPSEKIIISSSIGSVVSYGGCRSDQAQGLQPSTWASWRVRRITLIPHEPGQYFSYEPARQ